MDLLSRLAEWANANEGLLQALAMFGGLGALLFTLVRQRSEAASLQRARIALPATVVVRSFAENEAHELSGILASFGGSLEDEASRIVAHFSNADEAARAALALKPRTEGGDAVVLVCERGAAIAEDLQGPPGAIVATAPIRRAIRDAADIHVVNIDLEGFPFEITPSPEPSVWRSLRHSVLPVTGIALVLVGALWWLSGPGATRPLAVEDPTIQYATTSDGVRIAYWAIGRGPTIIQVENKSYARIDVEWQVQEAQRWYRGLAKNRRLVRYSPRGSGLSDPGFLDATLEEEVRDLRAVVDALGDPVVGLIGCQAKAIVAIRFAALHPERVGALALFNATASYRTKQYRDLLKGMTALGEMDADLRISAAMDALGIAADDRADYRPLLAAWANEFTPAEYLRVMKTVTRPEWEVVEDLDDIRSPTLIMRRRGNPVPAQDSELAARISNSRLMLLPGKGALPQIGFTEETLSAVNQFFDEEMTRVVVPVE